MAAARPNELLAQNVRTLRERHGWLQQDLADRLKELCGEGTTWSQPKVAKLERREAKRITLDEVYELAAALGVAPVYLVAFDDDVQVTTREVRTAEQVRRWDRGYLPLLERDIQPYWITMRPEAEKEHVDRMIMSGVKFAGELKDLREEVAELRKKAAK